MKPFQVDYKFIICGVENKTSCLVIAENKQDAIQVISKAPHFSSIIRVKPAKEVLLVKGAKITS